MEERFDHLDAPVLRVTYPDTHCPFSQVLEQACLPNADTITAALRRLAAYQTADMDAARAISHPATRSSWLVGCATIAAAALLVGVAVAFHGPMTFRPLGVRVQMGDPMRPVALAAIADVALFALAFRRRAWLRVASVLAVAIVAVSVLAAARRAAPAYPVSDKALIELATMNAVDGRQLYGPYSRYGWQHPGPLLFYLLAPFYAAAGSRTAGLAAGALAINLAALAAAVWVLVRHAGPALTVAFAALIALYVGRVPGLVVSSWNAHATFFASAALVVISAAVAAGRIRLLPLFLAVASFVLQTHIATFPLVLTTGAFVVAATGRRWIRGGRGGERGAQGTGESRRVGAGGALAAPPGRGVEPACRQHERDVAVRPSAAARRNIPPGVRRLGGCVDWCLSRGPAAPSGTAHRSQRRHVAASHRGSAPVAPGRCPRLGRRRGRDVHAWVAAQALAASVAALWAVRGSRTGSTTTKCSGSRQSASWAPPQSLRPR